MQPASVRGADRLSHAAPASKTLLIRAAERGSNLGSITGALLRLLDRYGAAGCGGWNNHSDRNGQRYGFHPPARYGFHLTGVTASGVPLLELTQPYAVRLHGLGSL